MMLARERIATKPLPQSLPQPLPHIFIHHQTCLPSPTFTYEKHLSAEAFIQQFYDDLKTLLPRLLAWTKLPSHEQHQIERLYHSLPGIIKKRALFATPANAYEAFRDHEKNELTPTSAEIRCHSAL